VNSLAFSPDGKTLASGGGDKMVMLWDVRSGAPRGETLEMPTSVTRVAFSSDGTRLAVVSSAVSVWYIGGARPVLMAEYDAYAPGLWDAAFSPDGAVLASAGRDSSVMLWTFAPRDRLSRTLDAQDRAVRSVAFSPVGGLLASASEDRSIILWDAGGTLVRTLAGHNGEALALAFSPDGRLLASGGGDNNVRVWDVETGAEALPPLTGHENWVLAVAFSPDGRTIASGGSDGTVRLWDAATGSPIGEPMQADAGTVWAVAFSPDGRMVASAGDDSLIRLWDAATGQALGDPLAGHIDTVFTLAFSPEGGTLASGSGDGRVLLWDMETRSVRRALDGHGDSVFAVTFSPDGALLASGSPDGSVILWDAVSGMPLARPFAALPAWVNSLAFSPDGERLAAGVGRQSQPLNWVTVWELNLDGWVSAACDLAGRNLTLDESRRYFGDRGYRRTCPNLPAHSSVIQDTADRAQAAAAAGDLESARQFYAQAAEWLIGAPYPGIGNNVCWFGSLYGFVDMVMPVCEQTVEQAPAQGNFYDTRGVARMLAGDLAGALGDIRFFTAWAEGRAGYEPYLERRLRWITELTAGANPIDEQTIQELLQE
jgi:WD40 repeat protein